MNKMNLIHEFFEGSLSPESEKELLKEVSQDQWLEKEFNLWQKCNVPQQTVVYRHKQVLLKPWYSTLQFRLFSLFTIITIGVFTTTYWLSHLATDSNKEFPEVMTIVHKTKRMKASPKIAPVSAEQPKQKIQQLTILPSKAEVVHSYKIYKVATPITVDAYHIELSHEKLMQLPDLDTVSSHVLHLPQKKKPFKYRVNSQMKKLDHDLKNIEWNKKETVPIEGF